MVNDGDDDPNRISYSSVPVRVGISIEGEASVEL